jgi:hypothetical protein
VTAPPLGRRMVAELCGTAFVLAVVVGSGIAAETLSPATASSLSIGAFG